MTSPQSGLIQNSGFENGELHPWTSYGAVSIDPEFANTGAFGVSITGAGAVEQRINIEPNTTYELSGFGKVAEDGHQVFFGVKDYEDDPEVYTYLVITNSSFVDASLIFTTGSDNLTALVYYYVEDSGNQAFDDDFKLVKVE